MKRLQLLLLFILLFLVGCKKNKDLAPEIFLGKVDIIDNIKDGDGNLVLKFYSFEPFDEVSLFLDNDNYIYKYTVTTRNKPVTIRKGSLIKEGFLNAVKVTFSGENKVDLSDVIMQFDNIYRIFNIGRYQRMDVEAITGMKLNNEYYNIDFLIPFEMAEYSYIPSINIDINVVNNNSFPVVSKSLFDVNDNPKYNLLVLENIRTTPFIDASGSKITKRIYLDTLNELVYLKTYFVYEFIFEQNVTQRDYVLVSLELGSDKSVYKLNEEIIDCTSFTIGEEISYLS